MNNNQSSRQQSRWVDRQHNIEMRSNSTSCACRQIKQIHRPWFRQNSYRPPYCIGCTTARYSSRRHASLGAEGLRPLARVRPNRHLRPVAVVVCSIGNGAERRTGRVSRLTDLRRNPLAAARTAVVRRHPRSWCNSPRCITRTPIDIVWSRPTREACFGRARCQRRDARVARHGIAVRVLHRHGRHWRHWSKTLGH